MVHTWWNPTDNRESGPVDVITGWMPASPEDVWIFCARPDESLPEKCPPTSTDIHAKGHFPLSRHPVERCVLPIKKYETPSRGERAPGDGDGTTRRSDVKTRTRVLSHYDDDGERCDGAERPRVFVANDGTYEMRHDAALHPVARARALPSGRFNVGRAYTRLVFLGLRSIVRPFVLPVSGRVRVVRVVMGDVVVCAWIRRVFIGSARARCRTATAKRSMDRWSSDRGL